MTSIQRVNPWTPQLVQMDKDLKEKYGPNAHVIPACDCDSFAPKQKPIPKKPWVMDETLPKYEDPMKKMQERMFKRALEQAESKAPAERNLADWYVIIQNRINNLPDIAKYAN